MKKRMLSLLLAGVLVCQSFSVSAGQMTEMSGPEEVTVVQEENAGVGEPEKVTEAQGEGAEVGEAEEVAAVQGENSEAGEAEKAVAVQEESAEIEEPEKVTEAEEESAEAGKAEEVTAAQEESTEAGEPEDVAVVQGESAEAEELENLAVVLEEAEKVQPLPGKGSSGVQELVSEVISGDGLIQAGSFQAIDRKEAGESPIALFAEGDVLWESWDEYVTEQLKNRAESIDVEEYGISKSDIGNWYYGLLNEHPELFYCDKHLSYSYINDPSGLIVTEIRPTYLTEYTSEDEAVFADKVQEALSILTDDMSDLEKAIALHDYIVINCEYDYRNYLNKTIPKSSYDAYGVLVNRVAVCNGYALAYKYLLNQIGIECYMVTSDAMNHAWNMIELDDELYQVDCTWDDPTWDRIGRARHAYMFLSDAVFEVKLDGVRNAHYDWEVEHNGKVLDVTATSKKYDDYFWVNIDTALIREEDPTDAKYYYAEYSTDKKKAQLYSIDRTGDKSTITEICDIGRWNVWGETTSFWQSAYTGLFLLDGRLYFNTSTEIKSIALNDPTDIRTELKPDTSNGYIYGSVYRDGKVYYSLHQSPNISAEEELLTGTLPSIVEVESITIKEKDIVLELGETKTLTVSILPEAAASRHAMWVSSNTKAVSVTEAGEIAAVGAGESVITVTVGGKSASCTVTVLPELFTISYDVKGVGAALASEKVRDGSKITEPEKPTEEGYVFDGWYKDEDYKNKWNFEEDTVTGDITLYAKWTEIYTVTYNANGHGTAPDPEQVKNGDKPVKTVQSMVVSGYVFEGWYKEKECTTKWDQATDTVTGDITLYAKWVEAYVVTFDANGHGIAPETKSVKSGDMVGEPEEPTEEGYVFDGWYKEIGGVNAWDFDTDTVAGNITLYAKWTKVFTVTFDVKGHGIIPKPESVRDGETFSEPEKLTEKGYIFAGWYKEDDCTNKWDFDKDVVTDDITLYARWIDEYTVTFDANGHGTAPAAVPVESGKNLTAPEEPKATGYVFAGWYKEEKCINAWNFDTDTVTGNITLYAKWTREKYTVEFDANGGSAVASKVVTGDEKVEKPSEPTREGYTFEGWYKEIECLNAWDFDTDMVTRNMTLYAKWTKEYTVIFDVKGHGTAPKSELVREGETFSEPEKPAEKGYIFVGWYKEDDCVNKWDFDKDVVTDDITLYARWINEYTVTFAANGHGTAPAEVTVESGNKLTEPEKPMAEGYAFDGWYKESECLNAWDFDTDTVTGNITLYAKWTKEYTVTFDVQGHGTAPKPELVKEGETFSEPEEPAEKGYIFAGWYKENDCTDKWDFDKDVVTDDVTLYAKWVDEYTVTFAVNGHGTAPAEVTVESGKKLTEPTEPKEIGYVFGGWFREEKCINAWDFDTDTVVGDITLYAKWDREKYTVEFEANGGSAISSKVVTGDEKVEKPDVPTKEGYTFEGWYADAAFDVAWKFDTDTVTKNMTLYAKWKEIVEEPDPTDPTKPTDPTDPTDPTKPTDPTDPTDPTKPTDPTDPTDPTKPTDPTDPTQPEDPENPVLTYYIVSFVMNGHGTQVLEKEIGEGRKIEKFADPVEEGYIFKGWYKNVACTRAWDFNTDTVTVATKLYARWEKVQVVGSENEAGDYYEEYQGEKTDLDDIEAKIASIKKKTYNGRPYTPTVKVTYKKGKKTVTLAEGRDYTVSYADNVNAGTGVVTVTGCGSYTGEITEEFIITPKSVKGLKVVVGGMNVGDPTDELPIHVYDGDKLLIDEEDYEISPREITSSPGKKSVTITGMGNYDSDTSRTVQIVVSSAENILRAEDFTLEKDTYIYTGSPIKPIPRSKTIAKRYYSVKYSNNENAGVGCITITGKKGYTGSVVLNFRILPLSGTFVVNKGRDIKTVTYNGKRQKPKVSVTAKVTINGKKKTKTLKAGKDYTVTYANNLHATSDETAAAVIITGKGNYADMSTKSVSFVIKQQKLSKAKISGEEGNYVVTYGKQVLLPDVDYIYVESVPAGSGKVKLKLEGIGDFKGGLTKTVKAVSEDEDSEDED